MGYPRQFIEIIIGKGLAQTTLGAALQIPTRIVAIPKHLILSHSGPVGFITRGGCELAYLLLELNCIADRAKVRLPLLHAARQALLGPRDITLTSENVSESEVAA